MLRLNCATAKPTTGVNKMLRRCATNTRRRIRVIFGDEFKVDNGGGQHAGTTMLGKLKKAAQGAIDTLPVTAVSETRPDSPNKNAFAQLSKVGYTP